MKPLVCRGSFPCFDGRKIFSLGLMLFATFGAHAADLPKLTDYPVAVTKIDHFAKAVLPESRGASRWIRDLAYDRAGPPDFADRFTLFLTGCGSGCAEFCVIDRVTGRVFPGITADGGPKVEFARDSRLIIVRHTDGMYGDSNPFYADCYLWENNQLHFIGRWATTLGAVKKTVSRSKGRGSIGLPS